MTAPKLCAYCKKNPPSYGSRLCLSCLPEQERRRKERQKRWREANPNYQRDWQEKNFPKEKP